MTSPKKRKRARRRVERTMDDAFAAAERGELALALKLGRRVAAAGHVNPRIWCDLGRIARRCADDDEAEQCFRQVLRIAPGYAAAFPALAELQADRGKFVQAVRLGGRAVELAPDVASYRAALARWRERAPEVAESGTDTSGGERAQTPAGALPPRSAWTERYAWNRVAAAILARGAAHLRAFLDPATVAELAALWDSAALEHGRVVAGGAERRACREPLPGLLVALRRELYGRAVAVARRIGTELGSAQDFADTLDEHLIDRVGGARPGVDLLRLEAGTAQLPATADRPRRLFPLAVALDLGGGGHGAELALTDLRPGRKVRRRTVSTRCGDALLYVVAERPVWVGGVLGLQQVAVGREEARDAPRVFFELRFDDDA